MDLTDYIRTASIVLGFILVVVWDRKIWMSADMIATAGFGVALIVYPKGVLVFQIDGKLDSLHLQLAQCFGACLLSTTVVWYTTRETRDGTVPITLMMSRIYSCGVLLMCMAYTQFGTSKGKKNINWTDQHMYFGMVGVGLWVLGNLIHLLRSDDFSTYPQHNIRINTHLRLDACLCCTFALINLCFPDFCLTLMAPYAKFDAVHLHLMRIQGVGAFGSAIRSLQAPGYLHEHDKRKQFLEKILHYLVFAVLIGVQYLLFGPYDCKLYYGLLGTGALILINSVLGYMAGGTIQYKFKRN